MNIQRDKAGLCLVLIQLSLQVHFRGFPDTVSLSCFIFLSDPSFVRHMSLYLAVSKINYSVFIC